MKKTSDSDREEYRSFCKLASADENTFKSFKGGSSTYNGVLEHVNEDQGKQYLNELGSLSLDEMNAIKKNDKFGSPKKYFYDELGFEASPSSLRYIHVHRQMKDIFGSFDGKVIAEIGGGYGGQALIFSELSNIKSYSIFDLPETLALTEKYLRKNRTGIKKFNFYSCFDVPENKNFDILISNYALSECTKDMQNCYLDRVVNKSKEFYMIFNFSSPHAHSLEQLQPLIQEKFAATPEIPQTSPRGTNILLVKRNKNLTI
tara:strand:+ start:2757 stop:3536 length:780 start_codon:yes stop_codon:yes gene_type:complete